MIGRFGAPLSVVIALASFSAMAVDKGPQRAPPIDDPDAQFVSQSVPTAMVAGQSYPVSVTMYNSAVDSVDDWTGSFFLVSRNPANNTTWGLSSVQVGTVVPIGTSYTFSFTVVAPSTAGTYNFQWQMRFGSSTRWFGDTTPNVAVVVTAPNQLPTVSLTAPANGASYATGSNVAMSATASDPDGSIDRVEFLLDGGVVGQDTSSPYSYNWTATTGNHTVQARAVDNQNGTKTTSAINITVPPPNQLPTVSLTAPANGASFTIGQTVTVAATASDSDGTVQQVEFWIDGALYQSDPASPYTTTWTAATGTHTILAKAKDDDDAYGISGQRTITVTDPAPDPNVPPTVSLSAPANGASYTTGDTVTFSATASDSDGTIDRVEFFVDGVEVAQDTTSAYSGTWTATTGGHTLKARAWDDDNAYTDSASRTINVSAPPPTPVSITRTYDYNSHQELCRVIEPETGTTLMGYDAAGNLAWSASGLAGEPACSADGNTATILARKAVRTYDARNRIDTLTFPDNNGNQDWSYTPDGLPSSITTWNDSGASSVVNSYLYNKRRLPVAETLQVDTYTWTASYTYDGNASLSAVTYPEQMTANFVPNALGQPTQGGNYAFYVTYFPNGATKQFTYGNDVVHVMFQNARGLPAISQDYGTEAIHRDEYDYDQNGNVVAITDATNSNQRGNRDMVYDGLDRLTAVTSPMFGTATYTYNAVDNLTRVQVTGGTQPRNHDYCYDEANRLTNVMTGGCSGGASVIGLGYDVQGNLANKSGVTYTFDYGNRLRSGGPEIYRYDAHGRRVRSSSNAGLVYSFYSQSGQILYQRDERAGKHRHYTYLNGSLVGEQTKPLAGGSATNTYQHTDALGSPVAVTDVSQTVLQRSEYEPYGYLLNRATLDGPGYTGHITDAATGLVYMQQRYYDPMCGCFLSTDPVTALSGPFNRYWYANANPYKFTDPDGRDPVDDDPNHRPGGYWKPPIRKPPPPPPPPKTDAAIAEAMSKYKIVNRTDTTILYMPGLRGATGSNPTSGVVWLGDGAFSSWPQLGQLIGHELTHEKQRSESRYAIDDYGAAANEAEAYKYNLENAVRYGSSSAEMEAFKERFHDYYDNLPQSDKDLVNGYDYTSP